MHLIMPTFSTFILLWIALALLLVPVQLKLTAPYGRHTSTRWGWTMGNRWGWILMEIVSPAALLYFFMAGENEKTAPLYFLASLWLLHYLNRSLIFPLRTRTQGKQIPVAIVASAICFNAVNGWANGHYLGALAPPMPEGWFGQPRVITGLLLFVGGAAINIWSDERLLRLRRPGETGYRIPQGGLFRYLSCPNHLGEIIEWAGFALMAWNLPALAFAIWTAANLIPRALSHHRWYREHFPDYPLERKALIPYIL
jgi:3-oxo-5-alpha-steroid 4-dehydrogenase 1